MLIERKQMSNILLLNILAIITRIGERLEKQDSEILKIGNNMPIISSFWKKIKVVEESIQKVNERSSNKGKNARKLGH